MGFDAYSEFLNIDLRRGHFSVSWKTVSPVWRRAMHEGFLRVVVRQIPGTIQVDLYYPGPILRRNQVVQMAIVERVSRLATLPEQKRSAMCNASHVP